MKKIIFEAEVQITDKEFNKLKKTGLQMIYNGEAVATVMGKDIRFIRAYVKEVEERGVYFHSL